MGDLKLFMSLTELKGFTTNKLKVPTEKNEYNGDNHIMYHGESVLVTLTTHYEGENSTTDYKIYSLTTTSKKFKTKSGMGVGNTRAQLVETYKNSFFEVTPEWNDEGKRDPQNGTFAIHDYDAGTQINFRFKDNVVVEIIVFVYEGC